MRINGYDLSNISTPFCGFRQSGFGRDRSIHAVDKYMDTKIVWQRFLQDVEPLPARTGGALPQAIERGRAGASTS